MYGEDPTIVGVSMGVCPGQDSGSWVHGWSLNRNDHSPKFLVDYLKEKKPEWQLWTFQDFEAEYPEIGKKSVRVELGKKYLGIEWLWTTNSCQLWFTGKKDGVWSYLGDGIHPIGGCGKCHSCTARYVAVVCALGEDKTPYRRDPLLSRWILQYAAEYKNMDLFIKALPVAKDRALAARVIKEWLERKINA
jgi:hypothetical protein